MLYGSLGGSALRRAVENLQALLPVFRLGGTGRVCPDIRQELGGCVSFPISKQAAL